MKKIILVLLSFSVLFFLESRNGPGFNTAFSAASSCTADASLSDQSNASEKNSIQWCLDTYFSKAGGTVSLTSGTYKTSSAIVITSETKIIGSGKDKTTIKMSGSGDIISNKGNAVSNIRISDVTIKGSGSGTSYGQACIIITDSEGGENSHILIRDSIIQDCGQYGIHIKGADGVHITYVTLSNNGTSVLYDHNIYLRRVSNAKVELSTSKKAAGNGLNVADSDNIVVRNFTAKYNGQNGVRFSNSDYVKAYIVTATNNGYLSSDDSTPCEAGDKLCNGIELRTEDGKVNTACIKDSTMTNNYTYGVYISSADDYTLTGNTYSGNGSGDKSVSSSSTKASSDVCGDIPEDSSAWPFSD